MSFLSLVANMSGTSATLPEHLHSGDNNSAILPGGTTKDGHNGKICNFCTNTDHVNSVPYNYFKQCF